MPITRIQNRPCKNCSRPIAPDLRSAEHGSQTLLDGDVVEPGKRYWIHVNTNKISCTGEAGGIAPVAAPIFEEPTQVMKLGDAYWELWEKFEKLQIAHKSLQARHDAILRPRVARKFKLRLNRK